MKRNFIYLALAVSSVFLTVIGCQSNHQSPTAPASLSRTNARDLSQDPTPCSPSYLTWTTLAPMPTARDDFAAGVVNGILYAVGGVEAPNTVEAYDPATNSWSTKAPMPTGRSFFGVGVVNGILYAVGGGSTNTMEAYNPATNSWTTMAPMPTDRAQLAVGVVNGILYAVGGSNGGPLNTVEAYNPATNSWSTKAPMPTARVDFSVGVVNGILYAAGGWNGFELRTLEAYNPSTNTWTTGLPGMPTPRLRTEGWGMNGQFYVADGSGGFYNLVESYNPSTNSWTSQAPDLIARYGPAGGVINDVVYLVGGSRVAGSSTDGPFATNNAATLGCGFTPTPTPTSIYVNCGGPQYVSASSGITWQADHSYFSGIAYTSTGPISGTQDPTLYESERSDNGVTYIFTLANHVYNVTLKYAETYNTAPGQRIFDVALNGSTVLSGLDLYAVSGGKNIAYDRTFPVTVTNGILELDETATVQTATIQAIAIVPSGPTTPTATPTPTFTFSPTQTPGGPPITPITSPTPGCTAYADDFSTDTLGNYDYFDHGTQAPGTAAGEGFTISGGQLDSYNAPSPNFGGMAVVNDALFSHSIADYTVQADFKVSFFQAPVGLFGLVFRTGANGSFYGFQWDVNSGKLELEKNTGSPSPSFTYLAQANPTGGLFTGGGANLHYHWVHLKVLVLGNRFQCYVNYNDGNGEQVVFDVIDNASPYTSGGAGIRAFGYSEGNALYVSNFNITACPGVAPTSTPTSTSTVQATDTATSTPVVPQTSTPTSLIPDDNLRQAILETLETATPNATVTINVASLAGLTRLVADNNSVPGRIYPGWVSIGGPVTSLKGLEYCTNLQSLYLESNAITDLSPLAPLSQTGNLQFLDLDFNNGLSDLSPLSGLTSLTTFEVRSGAAEGDQYFPGALTDLGPVSNLTNLQTLQISAQPVQSLAPLASLGKLTQLYMIGLNNGNGPTDGDLSVFQNLSNLTALYAQANNMTNIFSMQGLTNLQYANLANNSISDIRPLAGWSSAATVILQYNGLSGALPPLPNLGNTATPLDLVLSDNSDPSSNTISDISSLNNVPGLQAPSGAVLNITHETAITSDQISALQSTDPQLTIVGP